MKFFSRYSNFRVVLRPGIPGQPLIGQPPKPGLYVTFVNGMAEVEDEEAIRLIKAKKDFGTTITAAETGDKWKDSRKANEPEHNVIDIKYGQVGKNLNPKAKKMKEEQIEAIKKMAMDLARPMAMEIAKQTLKELAEMNKPAEEKPTVVNNANATAIGTAGSSEETPKE